MNKFIILVAIVLTACGGGNVYAQQSPASNQLLISPTKTVDLANARFVSLAANNNYVIDHSGTTHPTVFQHVEAVTYADGFKNYAPYGAGGVYINLSQTNSVECVSSASVITWSYGSPQVLQDGCALSDSVKAYARR